MKIKRLPLLLATLILLFAGCQPKKYANSDKIEQRLVYQQYSAVYYAGEESLVVFADFYENNPTGTSVRLVKPSSISLNDSPMSILKNDDIEIVGKSRNKDIVSYHYSGNGKLPLSLRFNYINNDKVSYQNEFVISTIEPKVAAAKISKQSGVSIAYNGSAFSDNEQLYFSLWRKDGKEFDLYPLDMPEQGKIFIYPEDIIDVENGEYDLHFHRFSYSSDIKGSERGGSMEGEYVSKKMKITIVE
ncbi:hypothetical protein LJC53_06110 [Bacteroidales bacterium OttesenSCG-928-C03]|nr:hypothetical protein [Bacteroidales bacterium OttesenSCG-928-E04]MDL2309139.1 hypothetical protein [Bacteroidales bacterium OttesenSCG-928-C03]